MDNWDGKERRTMSEQGELLARIDERLKSMDIKLDKHIIRFDVHLADDKKFQDMVMSKILPITGGIAVIIFFVQWLKP